MEQGNAAGDRTAGKHTRMGWYLSRELLERVTGDKAERSEVPWQGGEFSAPTPKVQLENRALVTTEPSVRAQSWETLAEQRWQAWSNPAMAAEAMRHAAEAELTPQRCETLSAWLERLGRYGEAADVLVEAVRQSATSRSAAERLVRMARLQVRGGSAEEGLSNLLEAAAVWPTSPKALQLAGELACTLRLQDEAVSMLLEAADRWEQAGDEDRALRARHQAFVFAPGCKKAYEALYQTLSAKGREHAADGVMWSHAREMEPAAAQQLQAERLVIASANGKDDDALAAMIHGGLELWDQGETAERLDEMLARHGLYELLAARWEVLAWKAESSRYKANKLGHVAALYLGRLSDPDGALGAWIEALEADPTDEKALDMLRKQAVSLHDVMGLAEGLLRAATAAKDPKRKEALLLELAEVAEQRVADPSLAHWALEQVMESSRGESSTLSKALARLEPRVRLQTKALEEAKQAALSPHAPRRKEARKRVAALLRGHPDQAQEYLDVLVTLVGSGEADRRHWLELWRVASRIGAWDVLQNVLEQVWSRPNLTRMDVAQFGLTLVRVLGRTGQWKRAVEVALQVAERAPGLRLASAFAWIGASILHDDASRSTALSRMAAALAPARRAALMAHAGLLDIGNARFEQARRWLEMALHADPTDPYAIELSAELAVAVPQPGVDRSFEKYCSTRLPAPRHMQAMSDAYAAAEDGVMSLVWAKRWCDLTPWDEAAWQHLTTKAVACEEEELAADAFSRLLLAPFSADQVADWIAQAFAQRDGSVPNGRVMEALLATGVAGRTKLRPLMESSLDSREKDLSAKWRRELTVLLAETEQKQQADGWWRASQRLLESGANEAGILALGYACHRGFSPQQVLDAVNGISANGDAALWQDKVKLEALWRLGRDSEAWELWWRLMHRVWMTAGAEAVAMCWGWQLTPNRVAERTLENWWKLSAHVGSEAVARAARHCFEGNCETVDQRCAATAVVALLASKQASEAAQVAMEALGRAPHESWWLILLQRAAELGAEVDWLEKGFELVAGEALGREGRYMAHRTAAQVLLELNRPAMALRHATEALSTKVEEQRALDLLLEIGGRVAPSEVLAALIEAAEAQDDGGVGVTWWEVGARWALEHGADSLDSLELGLRALRSSPDSNAGALVRELVARAMSDNPDAGAIVELRLRGALKMLSSQVEGPVGARTAIEMTHAALEARAPGLALKWLGVAISCAMDLPEYGSLIAKVTDLAIGEPSGVRSFIDRILSSFEGEGLRAGTQLLLLCEAMARGVRDDHRLEAVRRAREEAEKRQHEGMADLFGGELDEGEAASNNDLAERGANEAEPAVAGSQDGPRKEENRSSGEPASKQKDSSEQPSASLASTSTLVGGTQPMRQQAVPSNDTSSEAEDLDVPSQQGPSQAEASKDVAQGEHEARQAMEAARSSSEAGDWEAAERQAREALMLARGKANLLTEAALVYYRIAGTQDRKTVEQMDRALEQVESRVRGELAPLLVFLRAEAIEALHGPAVALEYLAGKQRAMNDEPLISLARAEKMSLLGNRSKAVDYFEKALDQQGSLHGLRTRSQVAFAAAKTALLAGDMASAWRFYRTLVTLPQSEELASRLHRDLRSWETEHKTEPQKMGVIPPEEPQAGTQEAKGETTREASGTEAGPGAAAAGTYRFVEPRGVQVQQQPTGRYSWIAPGRASQKPGPSKATSLDKLQQALDAGDVEAGEQLVRSYQAGGGTARDILRVRRRQFEHTPWDTRLLEELRRAALEDRDEPTAQAAAHTLAVLEGQSPPEPPPWEELEIPTHEHVRVIVSRGVWGAELELLEYVWVHASHLFARPESDYGLTEREKVATDGPGLLAEAWRTARRALAMQGPALFYRNGEGMVRPRAMLTSPVSVLLEGRIEGTTDRFILDTMGHAMMASLPRHVLACAMPFEGLQQLFEALTVAFGPHGMAKERAARTAMLASELWRSLPSSAQRRVRELFHGAGIPSAETAVERSHQAGRRAGLLVSGDLRTALDRTFQDPGLESLRSAPENAKWKNLCRLSKSAADLVRFSVSSEYGQIRWRRRRSRRPPPPAS